MTGPMKLTSQLLGSLRHTTLSLLLIAAAQEVFARTP